VLKRKATQKEQETAFITELYVPTRENAPFGIPDRLAFLYLIAVLLRFVMQMPEEILTLRQGVFLLHGSVYEYSFRHYPPEYKSD
jgi:hypothetical protein